MKTSSQTVVKNALAYSGTNFISQIATVASGFLLRRILIPELMGIWNLVQVVRGYFQAISLGAISGAAMDLPLLRGAGEHEKEIRFRSVALTYSFIEIAILACGVWAYTLWKAHQSSPYEVAALVVTGILIVTARLQESYTAFFQAAQAFVPLSRVILINNLIGAILLPLGAYFAGIPGLLMIAVLSESAQFLIIYFASRKSELTIHWRWDSGAWKKLTSHGIAYRISDYPMTFFTQFDQLWVSKFAGLSGLGIYAFAKGFFSMASDITTRMGSVVYIRALTQYGEREHASKIGHDLRRFVQFQLLVCVPIVAWAVVSICPILIRQFVPLYKAAIPLTGILPIPLFFIVQNNDLCVRWIAEKRFMAYGGSNVFGLAMIVGAIGISHVLLRDDSLLTIAIATAIGYAGYFAYMVFTAGREIWGMRSAIQIFFEVLCAAIWTAAVFEYFLSHQSASAGWRQDLLQSSYSSAGMLVCLAPVIVLGVSLSGSRKFLHHIYVNYVRSKPIPEPSII